MYDCTLYDLVFNTEVLGLDNAVKLATAAVRALVSSESPA
jgi:hypothetical protein